MSDEVVNRKLDDLTLQINRLSRQIDDQNKINKHSHYDSGELDYSEDENKERGNWSGRLDFIISLLGYAVGLGNVWRFPYLCYKHGGAVFLIPYATMLLLLGMPIFLLEVTLGQYTSSGPITAWEMAPLFKSIGAGMGVVCLLTGIYYNMIIAWSIFYLCASFTKDLPWQYCDNDFNTPFCAKNLDSSINGIVSCEDKGYFVNITDGVCYVNQTHNEPKGFWNSDLANEKGYKSVLPSAEYLDGRMLGITNSTGLDDLGKLRWELVLCLLGAWVLVFLSLIKGIKSSGKVVYFTALFPYAVLLILLVKGLTLDGHSDGIDFYIKNVKWEKLQEAEVWKDAAVQIFFSLGISWGCIIALSSYNRFHNDALRDTIVVTIGNCLTSFFAGFVIFSYIGYFAKIQNQPVEEVADQGVTLAFVIYPYAVSTLPASTLWSILFFIMLITLGLDSQFALVESVSTTLMDQWPKLRRYKTLVILIQSIVMFICGLPLCTEGGAYLLTIFNDYSSGWNVLIISFTEIMAVMYVYGAHKYRMDISVMLGGKGCGCFPWICCFPWWAITWCVLTPAGILFILIFSWVDYAPSTYGSYEYPTWGLAIGWIMTLATIAAILFAMLCLCCITKGSISERADKLLNPSVYWGPALPQHRRKVHHLPNYLVDPHGLAENKSDDFDSEDFKIDSEAYENPGYM